MAHHREPRSLAACLDGFYRAAGGLSDWGHAAASVQSFVGADIVNLSYVNPTRGIADSHTAGAEGQDVQTYLRDWAGTDPLPAAQMGERPGTLTRADDLLTWKRYRDLDVFQGFYEPVGMVYQAATHVPFGCGWYAMLSMANGWRRGPLCTEQMGRLELLIPHLRNAMAVAQRLECLSTRARAAEQLLQRCQSAVVLCSDSGIVADLSPPASALLQGFQSVLRIRGGRLEAVDPGPRRRLASLLADPSYCAGYAGPRLVMDDPDSGETLECTVLVLDGDPANSAFARGEAAERMVLLRRCREPPQVDAYYLRHRFGLTPTEAGVLAALMEGHGLERIATDRGSTLQTVRTHIRTLRRKLDCPRQAQVVAKAWQAVLGMMPTT